MHPNWLSRLWLLPPLCIVAGVAALSIDLPVTNWFHDGHCPRDLYTTIRLCEAFAEGHGVAILLLAVWVLDTGHRWSLPRLAAAALGAGLISNIVKLFLARARPGFFIEKLDGTKILDSFRWEWNGLNLGHAEWQSFPSAHAATTVGLAIALAWRYPRGRWLFLLLGLLACAQRVADSHHFISDVCWGAAIGSATAWLCLRGPVVSGFFERLEGVPAEKSPEIQIVQKKIELATAKR